MFVKFTAEEINFTKSVLVPFASAKTEIIASVANKFNNCNGETLVEISGKELNCLYSLLWKADHAEKIDLWNDLLLMIEGCLMGWNGR